MTAQCVCAVIVTYHPTEEMMKNLPSVSKQVDRVVIVDNGSNANELQPLRAGCQDARFHLIENGKNLGIAEALNQGVRWARSEGYSWILFFDQDSKITPGFVEQMFATWQSHPQRERLGSIHPRYVHPDTGVEPMVRRAPDGGPVISLTSGALMPSWIFDKIGLFASEYFMDMVDYEYSFRIRAYGYLIADSRQAVLFHAAGDTRRTRLLGFSFNPTHHSATRRYYMSRNRIVLYKKYFSRLPRWVLQSIYHDFFRETIKCFIGENDRARKFRNFMLGTWDGLIGRMGKRDDI
jgi:rhamnosyltransferase